MPVADTELLLALNPRDKKHRKALEGKRILTKGLKIPDTAILEFQIVLRARGRSPKEVALALTALKQILKTRRIKVVQTLNINTLIKQSELEEKYNLSYFDSLIAASALTLDKIIISDDKAFDKIPDLKRIPIS